MANSLTLLRDGGPTPMLLVNSSILSMLVEPFEDEEDYCGKNDHKK